ncbi:hypothetical protein KDX38_12050 [Pseudomonas sp. CDFA 602]|uniref:hypothetical protein n=1 Tax=Pseudomonas californiensis TaxID=2829823 RepID=UPI001E5329D2|nr:hypothetical protein [Pseudomonas californiensis]MCD5994344.1 hypothetical protein [Pseudomonas californiensis]MCD5999948.1 hypothetical protein [Pseudomonas californiensis]
MYSGTSNAVYLGDVPSMAAFLPGLSDEERSDVQDVLLDAQLFADRQFGFQEQWSSWMHYYRNRLGARGLQTAGLVLGDSLVVSSVQDLMTAAFRVSGLPGHDDLAEMVKRSFAAMGIFQAAEAYFLGGFDQGHLGSFQVVPCKRHGPDEILILLCSLHVSTDTYSAGTRRLLFHFKGGSYVFSRKIYQAHRDEVVRYLGGRAQGLIRAITV